MGREHRGFEGADVKRLQIFPMTSSAFIGSMCFLLGMAFLLYFFFAPPPPIYEILETETGEVTGVFSARSENYLEDEESVSVRFDDGSIIYLNVPKRDKIQIGQSIDVDMLESDREKLIYRLAQDPVQP